MTPRTLLAGVSAAQLAAGLAGMAVALRRRRPYDVWMPAPLDGPFWHGSTGTIAHDAFLLGTAYSAPTPMLVAQLGSTVRLVRRGDRRAVRDLAVLGALMTPGYLVERSGRRHLRHWDPVETPVVTAGLGLAAAMAALGARCLLQEARGMPEP